MPATDIRFVLRVPVEIYDRLKAVSRNTGLSVNRLICERLVADDNGTRTAGIGISTAVDNDVKKEGRVPPKASRPRRTRNTKTGHDSPAEVGSGKIVESRIGQPKKMTAEQFLALSNSDQMRAKREGKF